MNSTCISGLRKGIAFCTILLNLTAWALVIVPGAAMAEPPMLVPAASPRIVIDPGHGGSDIGARGPTGLMEKTVSLELARKLALALESQYHVILTRSDDYGVDLSQRAATANQSKADMLISLHTGSDFMHRTQGIRVYYYEPVKRSGQAEPPHGESAEGQKWSQAHLRHKSASIALASSLNTHLLKEAGTAGVEIQSAPLKILEGANLPAVLVEIGYITHPATEMNLSSVQGMDRLSRALAEGIRQYVEASAAAGRP